MSAEIWDCRGSDYAGVRCGCCGDEGQRVAIEIPTDRGSIVSRDRRIHICLSCADEIASVRQEIKRETGL